MKKILFFICLMAVITGCKENYTPNNSLTGSWELVRQIGMDYNLTFAAGQGNILQFNTNNTYKVFAKSLVINEGSYRLIKKGQTPYNKDFDAIYMGEGGIMNAISLKADSLIISTAPNDDKGNLIMDGGTTIYIRQK